MTETFTLPGNSMLGYTYNILGNYADTKYVKKQVITLSDTAQTVDYEDKTYTCSEDCFFSTDSSQGSTVTAEGSSYEEYTRKMEGAFSVSGGYGAFTGTLSAGFSESVRASSEYYYYSLFQDYEGGVLKINSGLTLNNDVLTDLNDDTISPEEIFKTYGSHVVTGVLIGGQLRYFADSRQECYESTNEFTTAAQGSYGAITAEASYQQSMTLSESDSTASTKVDVLGGSLDGQTYVMAGDIDSASWATTIADHPAVIGFTNDGLTPIWEFCTDPTRESLLRVWFDDNYIPLCYSNQWRTYNSTSDEKLISVQISDLVGSSTLEEYFMVGFGGNVRSSGTLNRIGVCLENIRTGVRTWYSIDIDGTITPNDDCSTFEKYGTVPEGSAMTGLAVRAHKGNLKNIKLYSQLVALGENTDNNSFALSYTVYETLIGGKSAYDLDTTTSNGNGQVMTGLQIAIKQCEGKFLSAQYSDFYIGILKSTYAPQLSGDSAWNVITNIDKCTEYTECLAADQEYIIGFGGNVNKGKKLNFMGIYVENQLTGVRRWIQNEDGSFERSEIVPDGCVLVGVALNAKKADLKQLLVYYRRINNNPDENNGIALESDILVQGDTDNKDWDLDTKPTSESSIKALTGLQVAIVKDGGKYLSQYECDFDLVIQYAE